jgi:predicted Zn-dependent peptidase
VTQVSPAAQQRPGSTRTLLTEQAPDGHATSVVRRTVLPGGLRVITEAMPGVRSVTFGAWIGVGSRDESASVAGAVHYLEHLLFKGTRRRSAWDISSAMEAVGGELNAFTGKEYTCYHARVLDEDLPLAIDVIVDMLTSSLVTSADVEGERGVILEEIAMHDDDIEDAAHEAFSAALWGGDSPLGRPVLGSAASIRSLTRTQIAGYYRRRYRAPNVVIAAAGNVDHAAVVRLVRAALKQSGWAPDLDALPAAPRLSSDRVQATAPGLALVHRVSEQAVFVLGTPGIARTDDRRYALGVLNAALGGGPSSRLFQEVREKRGLAYSVYSFAMQYADTGAVGVSAGCSPAKADEVLALCREQLELVAADGITEAELVRGKSQLRAATVLGLEDTGSRMSRIAKSELVHPELPSISELLTRIEAVSLDDVRVVAKELWDAPPTLAILGPFDDPDRFAAALG